MSLLAIAASSLPAGQIFAGIGAALAYFLPSIIGVLRRVPSVGSVIVVNFFLGWTVIGWIVALAMAFHSRAPRPQAQPPG